jgi:hypothetical protein
MHPDDIPEELLRDFVGARYQVVMVRLNAEEGPMDRHVEFEGDKAIRISGLLCRDPKFWKFLFDDSQIFEEDEESCIEWLRDYLSVQSRSELKTNEEARNRLKKIMKEFSAWTQKS